MPIYSYRKEVHTVKKKMAQVISYTSLTVGALLLFWSFYPIISFQLYSTVFIPHDIKTPVPQSQLASSLRAANSVLGTYDVYSNNLRDFVQADEWFPSVHQQKNIDAKIYVKEYTITIPKLNIVKAKVTVGGENLSRSLVHFLPTSLPGEPGNVAIFGHSTLPQLFNVKDYKTIFTYLPSLEKGDKVIVNMGDQKYEYEVYDMFVVKPDQISVLEQKYDAPYLTLITCVPPGTFWNRLVVRAKLSSVAQNP